MAKCVGVQGWCETPFGRSNQQCDTTLDSTAPKMKLGDQVDAAALYPAFQRSVCIPASLRASDWSVASWAFSGVVSGLHLDPIAPSFLCDRSFQCAGLCEFSCRVLSALQEVKFGQHHCLLSLGCLAVHSCRPLFASLRLWTIDCRFLVYQRKGRSAWE